MSKHTQQPVVGPGELALEITFRIDPSHRMEFLQTLDGLLAEPEPTVEGAEICCFERVGCQNTFLWRESWGSHEDLEQRLQTGRMKTLMGAVEVLGELERVEILGLSNRSRSRVVWT